ncbi:MAG TPA: serine/threonine-protein kinase [Planctomycetota bacterium]|nr:serine/threonine-protein kinase [Planctomycetota bacterium]
MNRTDDEKAGTGNAGERAAPRSRGGEAPLFADRYEILGVLGEGSFGVVYLARDPRLGREVALKFLRSEAFSDPQAQARFLREARSLASVDHPNVVTVYDLGEVDGRPYLSLERVEGTTLREALESGPFSVAESAAIGRALLSALAAIHAAGLVHRDVKPGNVMLARDGRVKLMDFGLARGTASTFDLTGGGITAGTPYYMAPEQWRGKSASPQSDLFALGTLLYECLAGRVPFKAGSVDELQQAVLLDDPPPLRELRPEIPEVLSKIVEKALEKDPPDRFASASEMRAALSQISSAPDETGVLRGKAARFRRVEVRPLPETLSFGATPPGASLAPGARSEGRRRFLVYAGSAAAALVLGLVGITLFSTRAASRDLPIEVRAFRIASAGARAEPVTDGSTIRSGEHLYFEMRPAEDSHLYVFNVDSSGSPIALFPSSEASYDRGNPFEGGMLHHLPPTRGGKSIEFGIDDVTGEEVFYVVASRRPIPALEDALAGMRQVGGGPGRGLPETAAKEVAQLDPRRAERARDELLRTRGASRLVESSPPAGGTLAPAPVPDAVRLVGPGRVAFELRLRHES